jgi:hypothetical protein
MDGGGYSITNAYITPLLPVTIDASNTSTNTFGGYVSILGKTVLGGDGVSSDTNSAVFGDDNTAGYCSLGGGQGNTFNNWVLGGGRAVAIETYGVGGGYGNTIGEAGLGGGEDCVAGDHGFAAGFHGWGGPGSFLFSDYSSSDYFNRTSYTNEWGMRVQSIYWAIGNLTISAIEDTISSTDTAIPTSKAVMDYVDADIPIPRMTNAIAQATAENTTQGTATNALVLMYYIKIGGTNAVYFVDPRTSVTNWFAVATTTTTTTTVTTTTTTTTTMPEA